MRRHYFYLVLVCILLTLTTLTTQSVLAEGEPTPEPIQPPWITGQNTAISTGSIPSGEVDPSGIVVDAPNLVGLVPQDEALLSSELIQLAVPQRYQDSDDPTCGAAALGMALEFLALSEGGEAPDTATLIQDLDDSGFLYKTGTGVEELATLARAYGYRGASPFHGWTLDNLAGELVAGNPVVVSLGLNGQDQPGHFVTLTGMSSDSSWVTYNDPVLGEQTVSASEFMTSWGSQGRSGLTVSEGSLPAAGDPLLPWLGLLGAVSVLAVVSKQYPTDVAISNVLSSLQTLLGNPARLGLGGMVEGPGVGGGGGSSPPYTAPEGYHWVQKVTSDYGWKETKVTKTRQVEIMIDKKIKVGTRVWYEDVPRYRYVRVDKGHYAWRKVTKYKREKYVRYYRTTYVKKTRWVRQGWRWVRKTYYQIKRTPVYGYRTVPAGTKWERYWVSKWVTEKQLDGYTRVRHEKDIYETRKVPSGEYRTEYYTDTVKTYGVVGSSLKWVLKKDQVSPPSDNLANKEDLLIDPDSQTDQESSTGGGSPHNAAPVAPDDIPRTMPDWLKNGTCPPNFEAVDWNDLQKGLQRVILSEYLAMWENGEQLPSRKDSTNGDETKSSTDTLEGQPAMEDERYNNEDKYGPEPEVASESKTGQPQETNGPTSIEDLDLNLDQAFLDLFEPKVLDAMVKALEQTGKLDPENEWAPPVADRPINIPQQIWDLIPDEQQWKLAGITWENPTSMSVEGILTLLRDETGPYWASKMEGNPYGYHQDRNDPQNSQCTGGVGINVSGGPCSWLYPNADIIPAAQDKQDYWENIVESKYEELGIDINHASDEEILYVHSLLFLEKLQSEFEGKVSEEYSGAVLDQDSFDALTNLGYNKGANTYSENVSGIQPPPPLDNGKSVPMVEDFENGDIDSALIHMSGYDILDKQINMRWLRNALLIDSGIQGAGLGGDGKPICNSIKDLYNQYRTEDNAAWMDPWFEYYSDMNGLSTPK